MRSLSLTWTDEITENEALVFVSAVHEAIQIAWERLPPDGNLVPFPEIRPFGNWVLEDAEPTMDYYSFQWYQDRAADSDTGHLRADRFLNLIVREPWQQDSPHYDLSLVHQPLIDPAGYPTLGQAVRGCAAVLSAHSIRSVKDTWQRFTLLHRLAAHYVGQILAVPIYDIRKEAHCTNVCAMRPTDTLSMLVAYANQETSSEILYCEQCQEEMGQRLVGSHWGSN